LKREKKRRRRKEREISIRRLRVKQYAVAPFEKDTLAKEEFLEIVKVVDREMKMRKRGE
jgi:hypothetical protein